MSNFNTTTFNTFTTVMDAFQKDSTSDGEWADWGDSKWGDSEWPDEISDTRDTREKVKVNEPLVNEPLANPASPKQTLVEATMEIVVVSIITSPVSLLDIMKEEKEVKEVKEETSHKHNTHKDINTHKDMGKMSVKMGLGEFFEKVKQEDDIKAAEEAKRAKKREARKRARERKRDAGFTEVKRKEVPKSASISVPNKRQIAANRKLIPPTPKGKFVNTTLILKNLPYTGVTARDLRRFFERNAGPTKFVKMLTKPDGTGKGIAFIRFETRHASDKGALMNRFSCEGRTVYVEYAADKREK